MKLRYEFRPYTAKLLQPLATAHGTIHTREGILISLTAENGQTGFGEIAPLAEWGSETFSAALNFCAKLPATLDASFADEIADDFPCCQFAFENARDTALASPEKPSPLRALPIAALLPAGRAAIAEAEKKTKAGFHDFKWKIGIGSIDDELPLLSEIRARIPAAAQLRLDANGGLDRKTAERWLAACEQNFIEFLEQPLPVGQEDEILQLAAEFATPIALDESIASPKNLSRWLDAGWPGIYVIKPAIAGSPKRLRARLLDLEAEAIFSSAIETTVGAHAALTFAFATQGRPRALGFGTIGAFADAAFNPPPPGHTLTSRWLQSLDGSAAWEHLPSYSLTH